MSDFTDPAYIRETTIGFVKAQLDIIEGNDVEAGDLEKILKRFIKALEKGASGKSLVTHKKKPSGHSISPKLPHDLPPIGIIAQVAIPEIFRRGNITDADIAFLKSQDATTAFLTNHLPFIRDCITGQRNERVDGKGRTRYYRFQSADLQYAGKRYYLCKELKNSPVKIKNLLHWISEHGISIDDLKSLCSGSLSS